MDDPLELLDFDPVLACDYSTHDASLHGCVAEQAGLYLIADQHRTDRAGNPIRIVVCEGKMIWLRSNAASAFQCSHCQALMRISDRYDFLGKLSDQPIEPKGTTS